MIHDATIKVTCDGDNCRSSATVELEWKYKTHDESSGFYDASDAAVEKTLVDDHGWTVVDGKHFCDKECAKVGSP